MAGKPKLHELIAVEGELDGTAKKILTEATATFGKNDHFLAGRREVHMLADTEQAKAEELVEQTALTTTVAEKLDYVRGHVVRYWDALLQKEATNQHAKADLVVNGVTMAKDLPATFLLGMEHRLKALRAVYEAIPTLQPGANWVVDTTHEKAVVYRRDPDLVKVRTKKIPKPVVLYEATKEHPAQVKELVEDVTVGTITERVWSGMITPAEKSDLLGRIDTLLRACKKARQRANMAEIVKLTIAKAMMDFVNTGSVGGAVVPEEGGEAD